MKSIKFDDVSYHYHNSDKGIQNFSLEISKGKFIAVIGKNGAGKSTFLNLVAGLLKKYDGKIIVEEEIPFRDVGVCLQKQSIDWYLNVFDNVYLGARLSGQTSSDAKESTHKIINFLGLSEFEKSLPDGLSGGQQQLLQVARALVHKPNFLILDEPTSGLDVIKGDNLFKYLRKECDNRNCTVLVSSHDLGLLEEYCDQVLLIEDGKLKFFGKISDFFLQYSYEKLARITFDGLLSLNNQSDLMSCCPCSIEENEITIREDYFLKLPVLIGKLQELVSIKNITFNNLTLRQIILEGSDNEF